MKAFMIHLERDWMTFHSNHVNFLPLFLLSQKALCAPRRTYTVCGTDWKEEKELFLFIKETAC
jgi:hypothetical protein